MAYTRISNDQLRINKQVQESTDVCKFALNVPGPGLNIPFISDPHVRMQKWGANHITDIIGVENSLKNIDRHLFRESITCKDSYYTTPNIDRMNYSQESFNVLDSFITQPKWNIRDKERDRELGYPMEKNDSNIFIPFSHNLGTRLFEKDLFSNK